MQLATKTTAVHTLIVRMRGECVGNALAATPTNRSVREFMLWR